MKLTHPEKLIDCVANVEGKTLRVIEVLLDEQLLIVEDTLDHSQLQENQFGDIQRRGNKTYSIPFYSELDGQKLHPVVELFLATQAV